MHTRQRNRLTAWLGIFAMCLAVLAPGISQWRMSHAAADAPLCSVSGDSHRAAGHDRTPLARFSACGYCDLLAQHPPAPAPLAPPPFLPVAAAVASVLVLSVRFMPAAGFSPARPRAPPR